MGVDPIWLGIMIAVNLQTPFLTPPFGFALFYLRGVAPDSVHTSAIYKGVPLLGFGIVISLDSDLAKSCDLVAINTVNISTSLVRTIGLGEKIFLDFVMYVSRWSASWDVTKYIDTG